MGTIEIKTYHFKLEFNQNIILKAFNLYHSLIQMKCYAEQIKNKRADLKYDTRSRMRLACNSNSYEREIVLVFL